MVSLNSTPSLGSGLNTCASEIRSGGHYMVQFRCNVLGAAFSLNYYRVPRHRYVKIVLVERRFFFKYLMGLHFA